MSLQSPLIRAADPAFEVMCLAARLEFSSNEAAQTKKLVSQGVDWPRFLASVERNYVAPLVHRNLKAIADSGVPAKVLDTLRVRSKITAFKNETFAAELARLSQVFESIPIRALNYKGAVTAEEYYGSISLRNFNDLDFLVHRNDMPALIEVLQLQGYQNSADLSAKEFEHYIAEFKEFLFTRGEISIEPHWSLTARRYPFDVNFEELWKRSRTLKFRGSDLRVMSGEDSLLVLCVVGAKGKWQRLQMVTDVAACVRTFPNLDWASVQATARATGTVRILHLGLFLATELSGAQLPEGLTRNINKDRTVPKLARNVARALKVAPHPRRFLPDSPSIFSPMLFRQRERYRDRWLYLWRTTTTPEPIHLRRLPLPKLGFPLYWIFVPLHDFLMYPLWKFAKTAIARSRL